MDKFIIGENNSGKTRKMLEAAKDSGAVVICKNPIHMQNKANSYGIYGLDFLSYDEVAMAVNIGDKIAIDELGDFLKHHLRVSLDSFTMTVDRKEVN